MIVRLGNVSPVQVRREVVAEDEATKKGLPVSDPLEGRDGVVEALVRTPIDVEDAVTEFRIPDDVPISEALITVGSAYRSHHSDDPPEWVSSDSDALATLLVEEFTVREDGKVQSKPTVRKLSDDDSIAARSHLEDES